MNTFLAISN